MNPRVISITPEFNLPELKDKVRKLVNEYNESNQDVHVSFVSYEIKTYKKPKKGKRK